MASDFASSSAFGGGAANLVAIVELTVLAFLTSEFTSSPDASG